MRLQSVTLKQLDARGNQATYMLEGDIVLPRKISIFASASREIFIFMSESGRGRPVKFSAMMTSVGTKDSSWQTEFFSLQMAAKRGAGEQQKEIGG